jgi:hypothetical protein
VIGITSAVNHRRRNPFLIVGETAMAQLLRTDTLDEVPARRPLRRAHAGLVIADWGATAELVVLAVDTPLAPGTGFTYRGIRWTVTEELRDSRIAVAEPRRH